MVKLTSARQSRMYGPPGTRDLFENLNAFLYLFGTILFAAGTVLLLPSFEVKQNWGLWMILVGIATIVLVNFHDLHAHLAGIDYNFSFLTLDTQLWMVELAAPLVQAIGSILLCIATFLMIRLNKGVYGDDEIQLKLVQSFRLVVAGSALWLLGSIHNAFQVYEKTGMRIQVLQKAVSVPCIIASELLLVSGVVSLQISGEDRKLATISTWLALVASGVLVVAAVLNAIRVVALQQVDRFGSHLEILRGGAQEQLDSTRAHSEPLLSSQGKYQSDIERDQSNAPYRGSVVPSESLAR
ncbi:hypothetical protein KC19_1G322200 [Ceratodon purpureus]|uniref:Transmembrane protein n=1 Tax=Ceratodon purpureus TaxID=3225 RepID=A0A8T0JE29_CERPU|nr:hypothetical protein KC19_1G322200 [Ceratodon purpureus]